MVTVTTKTVNYSVSKGNQSNSVNATVVTTSGFTSRPLRSKQFLLKLAQLMLMITAFVLLALHMRRTVSLCAMQNGELLDCDHSDVKKVYVATERIAIEMTTNSSTTPNPLGNVTSAANVSNATTNNNNTAGDSPIGTHWTTMVRGCVLFWGVVVLAVVTLLMFLGLYAASTTTWIIITRTTALEIAYNTIMFVLMMATSGIAMFYIWKESNADTKYKYDFVMPLTATFFGIATALLYLLGIYFGHKDLNGKHARVPQSSQSSHLHNMQPAKI